MSAYVRPTLLFTIMSTVVMIVNSIAINKIPKKERKGFGFAVVVLTLVVALISMMYNFWLYAKETGIANKTKAEGATLFAKFQQKTGLSNAGGLGVPPATQ